MRKEEAFAIHESGHLLVALVTGMNFENATIGANGGRVKAEFTGSDERDVTVAYAGIAADMEAGIEMPIEAYKGDIGMLTSLQTEASEMAKQIDKARAIIRKYPKAFEWIKNVLARDHFISRKRAAAIMRECYPDWLEMVITQAA
jgi:hypothetical protein